MECHMCLEMDSWETQSCTIVVKAHHLENQTHVSNEEVVLVLTQLHMHIVHSHVLNNIFTIHFNMTEPPTLCLASITHFLTINWQATLPMITNLCFIHIIFPCNLHHSSFSQEHHTEPILLYFHH
ncbi:uncharacterized protein DS421_4g120980 [Arachis hypogaea]|nr:uncharacterized protein DS421_4g120980 [Arachis hypogaea]